jgi:Fe-S-cluster containining protein
VNPWEIARLAAALGVSAAECLARYTDAAGTRLVFDGPQDKRGGAACRLYREGQGCSVHEARPLACRLFPLGRRREGENVHFFHRGPVFPCLDGCPDVVAGPRVEVGLWLQEQQVEIAAAAQDACAELVSQLADGALVLLIDSGLAASGDRRTLGRWRRLAEMPIEQRAVLLGDDWALWRGRLLAPEVPFDPDPAVFFRAHHDMLQQHAQLSFGALADAAALSDAATLMFALALHLGDTVGAYAQGLAKRWIGTAQSHGARG